LVPYEPKVITVAGGTGAWHARRHGDRTALTCRPRVPHPACLDDPVPLFELVLSPKAAKRAVPTLGLITAAGIALLLLRPAGQQPS
jgi:hypothetical protein